MNEMRHDSLDAWSRALEGITLPRNEAADLRLTKAARFGKVAELGLLRTPIVSVNLKEFIAESQRYLDQVAGDRLIPFIDPIGTVALKNSSFRTLSGRPIARTEVAEKIEGALGDASASDFVLTFLKAYEIVCNGNFLVRRDGSFIGEFALGHRSPSQQAVAVDCRVTRDSFTGTFHYSSDDPIFRERIWKMIEVLPGFGKGREREFRPGYYEVGFGVEGGRGIPLFYDYRDTMFFIG